MRIPWPGLASGWGTVTPAGALHTDGLTGCPRAPCCRLFLCLWALQVGGMLVAPRLLEFWRFFRSEAAHAARQALSGGLAADCACVLSRVQKLLRTTTQHRTEFVRLC